MIEWTSRFTKVICNIIRHLVLINFGRDTKGTFDMKNLAANADVNDRPTESGNEFGEFFAAVVQEVLYR